MSTALRSIRVFLISLLAMTATTTLVHASEMRLRLAHVFPQNTTVGEAADEFARLINERTDGRISIAVFPRDNSVAMRPSAGISSGAAWIWPL